MNSEHNIKTPIIKVITDAWPLHAGAFVFARVGIKAQDTDLSYPERVVSDGSDSADSDSDNRAVYEDDFREFEVLGCGFWRWFVSVWISVMNAVQFYYESLLPHFIELHCLQYSLVNETRFASLGSV